MAIDRSMVLRQQQLLDSATQAAGGNTLAAERLARSAIMQSGLEYMQKKQAEDVAKGGREAELAMRKGSLRQRMMGHADKMDLAAEALAEGQKIRNIGLALNVASTLGAEALKIGAKKIGEEEARMPASMEALGGKKEFVGPPALPSDRVQESVQVTEVAPLGELIPLSPRPPRGAEPIDEFQRFNPKDPLASIKLPSGQDLETMIMNIVNQNMGPV